MKKIYLLFLFTSIVGYSQERILSPETELSVITCGPSDVDLYATFVHSAFRILDRPNKIDRVYNYGTFNFNTPNFYLKFVQGKLLYQLSAYDFGNFLYSYRKENRWVKGQILDLSRQEIQEVFDYLENNAKPENRLYKYDFFYDNCSTRLYDVMEEVLGDKIIFEANYANSNYSHRELIQKYLPKHPWGDFGIDFALGANIDRKANSMDYLFLPDYVFDAFDKTTIVENGNERPIVKKTEDILLESDDTLFKTSPFTPLVVFSLLAVLVAIITYFDYKKGKRNKILDFIIFTVTGLGGIVLLLLWFATDHTLTVNNFNVLWAFAPNLVFAFLLLKKKKNKLPTYYMVFLLVLLDLLVGLWIFKIQIFSIAMVPILGLLYVRYAYLWFYFRKETQN